MVRDADELHDALLTSWMMPAERALRLAAEAPRWLATLADAGRATCLTWPVAAATAPTPSEAVAWVATERLAAIRAILPASVVAMPATEIPAWSVALEPEVAMRKLLAAQLDISGPRTAAALAAELGLPAQLVLEALFALEADGDILRGSFRSARPRGRDHAARGPRRRGRRRRRSDRADRVVQPPHPRPHPPPDAARLRREIEPVDAAALMRFLLRWQRVARGSQLIGADGLSRILDQLGGFETAAGAWEREVLPARLHGYDPSWLDQMCLGGGDRLVPHLPEDGPRRGKARGRNRRA